VRLLFATIAALSLAGTAGAAATPRLDVAPVDARTIPAAGCR
jgi:hypothetical protein